MRLNRPLIQLRLNSLRSLSLRNPLPPGEGLKDFLSHRERVGVRGFVCLIVLICFISLPVQAARFTGNYLLEMCASDAQGKELVAGGHAVCQSYIAGQVDYHKLLQSLNNPPAINYCVPEDIPLSKLQNIVARYLVDNRNEHGSFIASPAVSLALYNAYPCKKKK
jgi:hypothetical protein